MTASQPNARPARPVWPTWPAWPAAILAIAGLLLTTPGCSGNPSRGYAIASPYDPSISTVAVPIFANNTMHPGLETTITESIIKRVQQQTPWRVTDMDTADVVLEGTVARVRLVRLSNRTGVGLVQEQGVEVIVSFELVDNRRGGTILSRQGFTALSSFVPANPTGERLSVGYRGAAEALAADIVDELGNTW